MGHEYNTESAIDAWRECGDPPAGRWLVAEHYPLVLRIVRANRPRRWEESDLAQEVFVKMFARLDTFDNRVPFSHWLSRVAVNTCIDALRAERRRPALRWSDLSEAEAEVLAATLIDHHARHPAAPLAARELLVKLLEVLNPEDRLLLRMQVMEEKSAAEISELTGWNRSVIKIRIFRARQRLKKELSRLEKAKP
jgi:RNA polymerase sigma factor (sigma-70 family)